MRYGFGIYTNKTEELAGICQHAEALGFSNVWVGEHIVAPITDNLEHPYGGRERPPVVQSDDRFYDIWVAIGAMLASTSKITISTGVYILPLRNPLITARACLTAAQLGARPDAPNRFMFGLGVGWNTEEFEAIGIPFRERAGRTDEIIDILRRLFAAEEFEFTGKYHSFRRLQMTPKPVPIQFIVGGTQPAPMRRAALKADGWVGVPIPLEESIAIRDFIAKTRREAGITTPFAYYPRMAGPDKGGSAERDNVKRYEDAGFENLTFTWDMMHPEDPRTTDLDFKRRRLDAFAKKMGVTP